MSIDIETVYNAFLAQVAGESYFERVPLENLFAVRGRLQNGNNRPEFLVGNPFPPGVTRLTTAQANEFTSKYLVLHQWSDDPRRPTFLLPHEAGYLPTRGQPIIANTGLSATLLESVDNPGVFTLAIRSTEYLEPLKGGDFYRDVRGADIGGIVDGALALAQWDALERYYGWLKEETSFLAGARELHVTGYSLGGHLAQVFTETHPEVASATIFNGAGRGSFDQAALGSLRAVLGLYRALLASPSTVQPFDDGPFGIYGRNGKLLATAGSPGGENAELDSLYARALSTPFPPPVDIYDHPRYLYAREVVSRLASLSGGKIEGVLELILSGEIDDAGRAPIAPSSADRITQIYGRAANNDRELVAGSNIAVPGRPVFIEDQPLFTGTGPAGSGSDDDFGATHSITLIGDSLAVMRLFRKIDRNVDSGTLGKLLARMSDQGAETVPLAVGLAEGDSLERAVKALARIYGLTLPEVDVDRGVRGFGRIDLRETMHQNILAIEKRVGSLPARVMPLWNLEPAAVAAIARGSTPQALAYRYALSEMLPFALVTDAPLYEARLRSGELKLSDERLPDGTTVGDRWLLDRATLLASVLEYNALDREGGPARVPVAGSDAAKGARSVSNRLDATHIAFAELGRPLDVRDSGKRVLYGNRFQDTLRGGAGADFLWGNAGYDSLVGGDGDDTLVGGAGADVLEGGRGNDVYVVNGQGDFIRDLDEKGSVFFERNRLSGGYAPAGERVYWSPDGTTRYTWGGPLLQATVKSGGIEHTFSIHGFRNRSLGIYLDNGRDPSPPPKLRFRPSTATRRIDPLTLDLDLDDHLDLLPVSRSTAWFDLTNDGLAERVGWIAPSDGLLVRDVNGNGFIDGVIEAFGGHSNDGFRDLAALDANRDKIVDAADPLFAELMIWQDLDGDGRSDEGELLAPETLGITAFPLAHERVSIEQDGNLIAALGSYVRNGVARRMGDVELAFDASATVAAATWSANQSFAASLEPGLFELPWLRGYGFVRDLPVAMNDRLSLRERVAAMAAMPLPDQLAATDALLVEWSGYSRVRSAGASPTLGIYDRIWMLEAFAGERVSSDYVETVNGFGGVATGRLVVDEALVEREWRALHAHVALMFALQSEAMGTARAGWFSVGADRFEVTDATAFETGVAAALGGLEDAGVALWLHRALRNESLVSADFLQRHHLEETPNGWLLAHAGAADSVQRALDSGGFLAGGDAHRDILVAGPGADQLEGGRGDDTYVLLPGSGADTIRDSGGDDTLLVAPGFSPATVRVAARADGAVELLWSPGHRTRLDAFLREDGGRHVIERIRFADGTLWTAADVLERARAGTDAADYLRGGSGAEALSGQGGDDTVDGAAGADTLSGGAGHDVVLGGDGNDAMAGDAGDDTLSGGMGDDSYRFLRGDGADVVVEAASGGADTLVFGPGIAPADVVATRRADGLELALRDSTDRVLLQGWTATQWPVERVLFEDGTTWSGAFWQSLAMQPTAGDDTLVGGPGSDAIDALAGNDSVRGAAGDDTLDGGPGRDTVQGEGGNDTVRGGDGDDVVSGGDGDDVLAGGSGNDQLTGETGNDTYVFGIGDGRDTVFDSGGSDALRLGAGIAPDAVRVRATAQDFQLHLNAADVLTLQLAMAGLAWRIESVAFADHPGVWWSMDDLLARARIPTDGADWLPGGAGPERIAAGAGNDTVSGNAGDDTLEGGPGLDSLLGGEGADSLSGDADNDWLDGGEGDDHLHGGAGADALSGGAGDDTYFFAAGHGADTVSEAGGFDELSFADGLAPADLVARFSGGNLQLSFRGTQDGVLLQGWTTPAQRVERVRFADGTQWDEDALRARGLEPTEGADVLPGGSTADALSGLGGNDSISGGEGDDRLAGGAGNDTLSGNEGADTLGGGAGDDFLSGDAGDDVFEYDRGDGIDRIADSSGADVLRFGAGIAPADVRVARRLDDFELWLRDGSGRVVLAGAASPWSSAARIETVAFADGSAWDDAELRRRAREATAGADTLVGGDAGDTLAGLGGDDVLRGEGGDDLLEGGAGTDWLAGGAGDDSYRFSPGDGSDRAQETGTGFDTVLLGDGLTPGNLLVQVSSLGMTLSSGADQLMLYGNGNEAAPQFERLVFADGTQWDVAAMFAAARRTTPGADSILGTAAAERYDADGGDDTVFAYAGADTLLGGAGNDSLSGGEGNDLLDGGPGDDRLFGEWNDDEYVFARGAGNDTLFDTAGLDRVRVAPGILPEDLRVALDGGGTLRLILRDGGGSLAMQSWTTPNYRIEHVMFDDGTDWDEAALRVRALEATEGADVLVGTSADEHVAGLGGDDTIAGDAGADTLEGGAGRDWILGGAGNDVLAGGPGADSLEGGSADDRYRVAPGDGIDIVTDTGGLDVLEFSAGIAPADVTGRFQGNDLVLHYGATDRVTLGYWRIASNQVEQVVFADGTRWDAARLAQLALQPSAGPDLITGTAAAERLDGGAGDDTLQGGEGNDTLAGGPGADQLQGGTGDDEYLLARGDGSDVVVDAGGADTLRFAASIAPADVRVSAEAGRHLVLALRDGSGAVRLDSVLRVDSQRIEQVRFADGTVWTHADLVAFATDPVDGNRLLTGQAGPDALTGGPGEDTLRGLEGADTLDGGAGDDRLEGGAGADAYVVRPGEGTDWIVEAAQSGVGEDVLQLRGVAPAAVRVWRDARHLHLDLGDGAAGRATLSDWYSGSAAARIEAVSFDDGTRWLGADLERMAATATAAADSLLGSAGGDALDGGAGDDALWGLEGADTLRGGPGDDTLAGGRGRDEIRFDAGDGRDELDASGGGVAEDVLALGAGLDPARLRVCSEGMDLVIGFTGAEDSIRVRRWWQGPARQLAELRFHDGTSLSNAQLAALAATATDGPDRLSGSPGPDTLAGGRGDDRLLGGDGDDTYLFAAGDGADRIADTAGADVLRFGEGIAPSRLAVRRDGNDALLSVDDDLVRIEDAWAAGTGDGQGWSAGRGAIERVEFADGTRWDAAVLRLRALGPAPAAVEPIPDRRVSEGAPFAFTLPEGAFTTVRRDGLAWSVALAEGGALPAWLRFDAATHALQGHAPEAAVGRWSLVATARDAAGQSARSAFVLDVADVNHAPRIVRGVPDVVLRAGETRAFALPDGFAADDDAGDALAVSLRGAGGIELPGWITFDAATGRIEAAPPAGSREALGLEVVVTDRAGAIAVAPFRLAVAAPNLAPRAATVLVPPPLVAGEPWLWRLPANAFNDPDSRRAPQLSVSGPEDGPLPHWLRFDPDTATLHGVAPGDTAGPVALRLVAEDAHGGIALQELVLQVLPSAGDAGLVAREAGGAMNGDSTSAAIDGASAALTGGVSPAFTGEAPASVLRDAPVAVSLSLRGAWRAPDGAGGEVAVQVDGRTVASVALGTRVRTHELALALRPGEAHRLAIVAPESLAAAGARAEIHAVSVAGLALAPLPGGPFLDAFDPASGAGVRAATRGGALVFAVPAFAAGVPSGDRLWGGVGATAMAGGAGSDTYVLDHAGDAVTERPGGGFDELQAWRDAVLPAHVEVLALAGEAREGTGNDAANRLFGSAGADRLHGAGGSDVLHGGGGDDRLEGGAPLPAQLVITARGGAGAGASARMSVKVNGVPLAVIAVACGAFAEYAIELPGTLVGQPLDVRIALAGGLGFGTAARAGGLEVAEVRLGEARLQGAGASAQGSRFERVAADGDLPGFLLLRSSGEAAFGFAAPVPARDLLDGGAGDDTLVGTGLLAGGRGDDLLVPGPGVSVLAFARGDGQDVVDVRAAQRLVLSLSGMPAVDVSASREEGDLVLDMGGADSVRLAHWYEPGFGVPLVLQHFDAAWEAASAGGGMRVSTSADEGAVDIEHALQRLVQAEAAFVSAGVLGGAAAAAHAAGASLAGLEFAALQPVLGDRAFGVAPQPA